MTVKDFMNLWTDNISVKIYQRPIKKIDKCQELVHRQTGTISTLLNSNQNYLDFEIESLQNDDGLIIIICKGNEEQERKTIEDITEDEWIELDFELKKWNNSDKFYDVIKNKLLSFILYQIYQDPMNYIKVSTLIRNTPEFQELAVLYNKRLRPILFPARETITAKEVKFVRKVTGFGIDECKKILEEFDSLIDAINELRKNSDEPQYDGFTESRFDVLDKEGNIIFSCKTQEEVRQAGYHPLKYRIRGVDCVGRYTYLK